MFTIEDLIEKINEPKTKDLFKDVYISYTQEQYRATVVMLWTVVVCDLVYKLQYLRDVYNDTTAIDILSQIADKQTKNSRSSEWEYFLINEINKRTNLINDIEKDNLEYLQKQRNLCAHPIITNDNILFKPNRELTRSLMRIALDAVLLKAPLLSKQYINAILEDLEKRQDDFLFWDEGFEKYIHSRYFKHLNMDQILALFKMLWRIVFNPHNSREEKNIPINMKLLEYIFKKYRTRCIDYMKTNIDFYTYNNENVVANSFFNDFIIGNYTIYPILSDSTKVLLGSEVRIFPKNIPYFFLYNEPLGDYLKKLNSDFKDRVGTIQSSSIWMVGRQLCVQAADHGLTDEVYHMFIEWYAGSRSFDEANILFAELLKHNLKRFTLDHITKLITLSSKNNQTYDRNQARQDNRLIMQRFFQLRGTPDIVKDTPFEDVYNEMIEVPF